MLELNPDIRALRPYSSAQDRLTWALYVDEEDWDPVEYEPYSVEMIVASPAVSRSLRSSARRLNRLGAP